MPATERLELRITVQAKDDLAAAADLVDEPMSEFVRQAVEDRTNTVLREHREMRVPSDYFDELLAALDAPYEPNEPTRRAARDLDRIVRRK